MTWSKIAAVGLTFCLWGLLVGCSSQSVQVAQVVPQERHLRSEILDMRNCDSNEAMHTTLASEMPVLYQVTIAKNATSTATGEIIEIPVEKQAILEEEVISAYQHEYEEAVVIAEQVELTIPAQMIHMYDIRWKEQVFSSTVAFSMQDQTCTADYTYALVTPELASHTSMACTA